VIIVVMALGMLAIIAAGVWCSEKVKEISAKVAEAKGGTAGGSEADIAVL
jgi:hypothetical protein